MLLILEWFLNDRRQFAASVALADEKNDLAILILENAESMPFLALEKMKQ